MFDVEESLREPVYKLDNEEPLVTNLPGLRKVMARTTPWEFYLYVAENPGILEGLYQNHQTLMTATLMRALQWRKFFKGKLNQNRNMIQIQFKSGIESNEELFLQNGINLLRRQSNG